MIEALSYKENAYVTLTYAEEALPKCKDGSTPTLDPEEIQRFLKRLRKAYETNQLNAMYQASKESGDFTNEVETKALRFYVVGEYGEKDGRPHYHAILFNFPPCVRGRTLRLPTDRTKRPAWRECCSACQLVGAAWGNGDVDIGTVERGSAEYVCQYVTKKMTAFDDVRLRGGQHPEFARMSLRPGIGKPSLHEYASVLLEHNLDTLPDVPAGIGVGKGEKAFGRYLRRELRSLVGKEKNAPVHTLKEMDEKMREVRTKAFEASRPVKEVVVETNEGSRRAMMKRREIFEARKKL